MMPRAVPRVAPCRRPTSSDRRLVRDWCWSRGWASRSAATPTGCARSSRPSTGRCACSPTWWPWRPPRATSPTPSWPSWWRAPPSACRRRAWRPATGWPSACATGSTSWSPSGPCARAGLVFVGLSTRLAPTQWAYMLSHSGAALALGEPEFVDGLRAAGAEAGLPPDRVREVGDHLTGRRRPWRGAGRPLPRRGPHLRRHLHLGHDRPAQGQPGRAPGHHALGHRLRAHAGPHAPATAPPSSSRSTTSPATWPR